MTPEQREEYEVAEEAAEIAREILAKPDKDYFEYGSIIYRGLDGVITHTPLQRGTPTSVQPSTEGMPHWGAALGMVHSHPGATFIAQFPDLKLLPTNPGDWVAYNSTQSQIESSLLQQGFSAQEASSRAADFNFFVFGASGPVGTGMYKLYRYEDDDSPGILGDFVSTDLGTCGGSSPPPPPPGDGGGGGGGTGDWHYHQYSIGVGDVIL
jgi:hypothetical protein